MTKTRKLFALLLAALMMLAVMPVASFAAKISATALESKKLALLDEAWTSIENVEAEALGMKATPAEVTMAAYKATVSNPLVDAGSIVWESDNQFAFTVDGMHCVYCYRVRNTEHVPAVTREMVETAEEVAAKGANCGSAGSANVLLVGPNYNESCTTPGYYDSSFTAQYMNEARSIATATNGTCTMLGGHNATGPAIASAYMDKGVVIYDSHGVQSGTSSYLCLTTNTGITSTDYSNGWAVSSGSEAFIDGRYIQNHVSGTLSNCLVWMAICEGMKKAGKGTTGTALLAAGAGCVYGYSQSVSFTGDYKYEATFWTEMKNGKTVAQAIATMKSTHGNWDPAYSSSSGAAWPIVMSAVDAFPSNPDGAQTVNCDWELFGTSYTVTATSNNTNYGTVSVSGTTITASPKTGYYAAGYTVTSGTATVSQNGNIFTVTPSSDCTVRINFAAKTQYTINFVASGTAQGSQTAYSGDSITLPTTAAVNPDGWTFNGWVANQVAETTTKPTFYNPGASYPVTGNATLYALYTRIDGEGSGEVVYQLTDSIEDGGKYIIVAQGSISGTTGKAVGNTVVTSNKYLSPISVTINSTDNTVTATSTNLPKVVWEASGNATSGYSFYNAAVGKYMALNSAQVLYPATSGIVYWLYESNQSLNNQVDTEGYYWLSYSDGSDSVGYSRYTTSTSSDNAINLYKETTLGTTYYTTDPVASTPTYTVTFKDWNGTVLSTQTVEQGASATAPANPTREGYTFTGWDVAFNNVQSDLVVTAQYTVNSYTLTINYVYANGGTAATAYSQSYNYGASYSVTSPSVTGYTPDQAVVSGTMGAANVTVTVTYTKNAVTGLLGDVNCDGVVDFSDVTDLFAFLMNTKLLTDEGLGNADLNGDGVITMDDVSALYTMILNN